MIYHIIISMIVVLSLCLSIFNLLVLIDRVTIKKHEVDKYEKWRNQDGLLGRKRE